MFFLNQNQSHHDHCEGFCSRKARAIERKHDRVRKNEKVTASEKERNGGKERRKTREREIKRN